MLLHLVWFVLPCPLCMRQFPWSGCTSLSPTELLHFASRVSPGSSIVAAAAWELLAYGKTNGCDKSIAFCMLAWLHNCLIFAAPPPAMSLQSFIHRHGCASPNGLARAQTEPARISPTYITPLTTLPPPQPLNHHTHPPLSQPRFPQWTVHNRKRNKKNTENPTQKSQFDDHRQRLSSPTVACSPTVLRPHLTPPQLSRVEYDCAPASVLSRTSTSPVLPRT
jgi:hypothetical protein